ncbi:MAG: hypothetical protein [Microviridae sp.]|nr:MAG: hypothetical protein [Microviridae sp.]
MSLAALGGLLGQISPVAGKIAGPWGAIASTAAPIAASVIKEIHAGVQRRKERLYNSPAQQVKRLREAGLPTAAGSNITGGQTQPATVGGDNYGTNQLNDNLGKSITRQIDRKKLQIHGEELTKAAADAAIAAGNARNQLNPKGVYENTNQGLGTMQALGIQAEALKGAQIVNKYMPLEKNLNLASGTQAMRLTEQNIKNIATANQIQLQDLNIKKILANYQERMSKEQLNALISDNIHRGYRNTGASYDNDIKRLGYTIELATMAARIEMAKNAALISGQSLEAAKLSNQLTKMSMPSTLAYYTIRRGMDEGTMAKPNLGNTLLYLGMFQPNTSNYNIGQLGGLMPTIREGNTYNNSYLNQK